MKKKYFVLLLAASLVFSGTECTFGSFAAETEIESETEFGSADEEFSEIQIGDENDTVVEIQEILIDAGYLSSNATGYFGEMTEQAVKDFQAENGLEETGVVDTTTYSLLLEKQQELLMENMPEGLSTDEDEWEAWESTKGCGITAFMHGCEKAGMTFSVPTGQADNNHKLCKFVFINGDSSTSLKDATFYYCVNPLLTYVGLYTEDIEVYESDDFKEACIRFMLAYNVDFDSDNMEATLNLTRERAEEIVNYCFDYEIEHCVVDNMRIRLIRRTDEDDEYYSFHIEY
ncbi:MAG: peptidoglycan-binding protein [Clostridiales bacterium]|nr:peptidoglycan-binding protein [Clostridiales bacterium]